MGVITQKTTMAKKETTQPDWLVLDVDGMIVGRVATQIATVLMGKHKAGYTPHVDCGDVVVVVNAHRIRYTGKEASDADHPYFTTKMNTRVHKNFSGYPSGLKVRTAAQVMARKPEMVLQEAVRRMLPKSTLGRHMLKKLRLFNSADHPHQAQQPKPFPEHLLP